MTEITLRLVPAPEATGTGIAYFDDLADAARARSRGPAGGRAAGDARVPRPRVHRRGRGLRAHRASTATPARCCSSARRRPPTRSPRHAAHGRGVRGRGRDGGRRRGDRGRGRRTSCSARRAAACPRWRASRRSRCSRTSPSRGSRLAEMVERIDAIAARHGAARSRPSATPATATCTRRSSSTRPTGTPSSARTRPSTRSSPRRSRWAGRSPASTASAPRSCAWLERPARRRPARAAAPDQDRVRPARHPQPGQARLVSPTRTARPAAQRRRHLRPRSCSTAASRAASACRPARPTR